MSQVHPQAAHLLTFSGLGISMLVLAACAKPAVSWDPETVMGERERTVIYGQTLANQPVELAEVAQAARIVGRLRKLNVSEQAILQKVVEKRFNFLVTLEMEKLRSKYEPKQQQIRRHAQSESQQIRQQAAQGLISTELAHTQQLQIEQKEKRQLGALEVDWKKEALEMMGRKYGSTLGIAVHHEEEKHVIAMANVQGDKVQIISSLYTLNRPVLIAEPGSGVKVQIQHDEKSIIVLEGPPVNLAGEPDQL